MLLQSRRRGQHQHWLVAAGKIEDTKLRVFESGLLPRDGRPCCPCRHGCRNRFCSELTVTSANVVSRERKNLFSELLLFFWFRAEGVATGLRTIRIGDCGDELNRSGFCGGRRGLSSRRGAAVRFGCLRLRSQFPAF